MPVKGIERVKINLGKKLEEISDQKTEKAVYIIASQGRAVADTMTPVDTSNLINSGYAPKITKTDSGVRADVGYTAKYAFSVHEKPGTLKGTPRKNGNGQYWDPSGEPQFLAKGFEEIKPKIKTILKEVYK